MFVQSTAEGAATAPEFDETALYPHYRWPLIERYRSRLPKLRRCTDFGNTVDGAFKSPCPFCKTQRKTLYYFDSSGRWLCSQCQQGGTIDVLEQCLPPWRQVKRLPRQRRVKRERWAEEWQPGPRSSKAEPAPALVPDPTPQPPPMLQPFASPAIIAVCAKCGERKVGSEFVSRKYPDWCRDCFADVLKSRVKAKYTPEKGRRVNLRAMYGMAVADYDAMVEKQGGVCAICGLPPLGRSKQTTILHVDHDHATGRIRGLLCSPCNRALGGFKDDSERLSSAIRYLSQHS